MLFDEDISDDERRHTLRVRDAIAQEIASAGGWLSFERYMDFALYAPGLGYYSAGARKLGAGGDFTTAPEISSLFGACVAKQCAEVLGAVREGSILEVGAGSGRLAVDVLRRLESQGQLPVRYLILEISADLRERQRARLEASLPHLSHRVEWLDALPEPLDGVIFANEVLDALPVARFRWNGTSVEELGVVFRDGAFSSAARPADPAMTDRCRTLMENATHLEELHQGTHALDGYVSEYCPRLPSWAAGIARCLRTGAVFWFDYGLPRAQYYLAERRDGTLVCHFRHRVHHDLFRYPGLSDLTAWVDFTTLAEAAGAADCKLAGFTTQAYFLAGMHIDAEMQASARGDANRFARLANQARQLMLPGEMGERFKAMAWLRGLDLPLSGFALQDLRHTL
ncbi:MAG TPA: SAM-dependent methyltransferase [Steroidobacteraceae bacterium]|nr:SAM-dependent methyltransferase [Steroidobacteraceae bacterium]